MVIFRLPESENTAAFFALQDILQSTTQVPIQLVKSSALACNYLLQSCFLMFFRYETIIPIF